MSRVYMTSSLSHRVDLELSAWPNWPIRALPWDVGTKRSKTESDGLEALARVKLEPGSWTWPCIRLHEGSLAEKKRQKGEAGRGTREISRDLIVLEPWCSS